MDVYGRLGNAVTSLVMALMILVAVAVPVDAQQVGAGLEPAPTFEGGGWRTLPIRVERIANDDVIAAVQAWNDAAGRELFRFVDRNPQVTWRFYQGRAYAQVSPNFLADVYTHCSVNLPTWYWPFLIAHELGHCLGLMDVIRVVDIPLYNHDYYLVCDDPDHERYIDYWGVMAYCYNLGARPTQSDVAGLAILGYFDPPSWARPHYETRTSDDLARELGIS